MAYLIKSDSLDGVWFGDGDTKLGTEALAPVGKMRASLAGDYTITKGINQDGSRYSGSLKITPASSVCATCYALAWKIGSSSQNGVAVSAASQAILAAAFTDGGTSYGALQYQIGGKVLTGTWTQSIAGAASAGVETITKL